MLIMVILSMIGIQQIIPFQYNAALIISGATRGSSKGEFQLELRAQILSIIDAGCKNYICFTKSIKINFRVIYTNYYPKAVGVTKQSNNIPLFRFKHNSYENIFFLSLVIKWDKLDSSIRNVESLGICTKRIL